jgi:lipopolysaccharide/colanic/teichoic acid biosynthesis glycosyltransferase
VKPDHARVGRRTGERCGRDVPYPWPKRLTDRVVPALLLLLFSPVILLVLATMGLDAALRPADRGPIFYRERRISCGREFDLLKFRVLRTDVLRVAAGHVRRYEKDLANLTWAGRHLIKRWYLDELPQLWNILRGDMSLVGPRPWPLEKAQAQIESGVRYRLTIRAGWTGPAQLQKGAEHPVKGAKLDRAYVDHCRRWSGWRLWRYDLAILARTVRLMARGQGLQY